ncbi:hypothetical protein I316_00487 [Kwoniella heveanensis BCC8398]|uniref:Uncharacterized protein n=1 Tax=Kwoniella heveanensis BCC8398 TaxID=1296120 RepID=A0A1B9H261_9TREE|nr:hypothetical protein I316_00487 [Kwoniella heveanensis BCC8398]
MASDTLSHGGPYELAPIRQMPTDVSSRDHLTSGTRYQYKDHTVFCMNGQVRVWESQDGSGEPSLQLFTRHIEYEPAYFDSVDFTSTARQITIARPDGRGWVNDTLDPSRAWSKDVSGVSDMTKLSGLPDEGLKGMLKEYETYLKNNKRFMMDRPDGEGLWHSVDLATRMRLDEESRRNPSHGLPWSPATGVTDNTDVSSHPASGDRDIAR